MLDQFWLWSMQSGLKNAYESIKAFSETDFTEDLKKFDVPTLVLHGEDDQIVPVKDSAMKSARLIKGAKDVYYPGAPHGITATHQDQVNAELLAFLRSSADTSRRRRPHDGRAARPSAEGRFTMKIVIIGGTGLIGSKLVAKPSGAGHEAVAASPNSGVNTLTGEGLAEVLDGASVVVDVSNSPSFEDAAVLEFFETSTAQSARRRSGGGRGTSRRVVGRRQRPSARQRLPPREGRAGEADQRARRSRTRSSARRSSSSSSSASPTRPPTATRCASPPCCSSPWRRTMSRRRWRRSPCRLR